MSCEVRRNGSCGFSLQQDCPGRCGPGCTTSGWYFKDCLDHDHCVNDNSGSVLNDNPTCGDEFDEAADDFLDSLARNMVAAGFFNGAGLIIYQLACQ